MSDDLFYGPDQAAIHHESFGKLAAIAAEDALSLIAGAGFRRGTVVDLGCGSGILAGIVTQAGFEVVGVDISPAMIELARANAPNATFQVGPLLDFDLPRAVAVTGVGEALNYAADERAGIEELERLGRRVSDALEPGGVFLAHNVVNKASEMEPFLKTITTHPRLFTSVVSPGSEGMSVSVKLR